MAGTPQDFTKVGFFKTFVRPGVSIFLIPAVGLAFFLHAQARLDGLALESALQQIRQDATMSPEERAEAIAFFTEHPFSELMKHEQFAAQMHSSVRTDYLTFRWMIRLAAASIVAGVAIFAVAGICIGLSRKSQRAQYVSLAVGWQSLRIYGALQTIIQGILVVALSYWMTALWFHVYFVKLIIIAGIAALFGVLAVIRAIFQRPRIDLELEGRVLDREAAPRLWEELEGICDQVGTTLPDQVIVGIDDNFFVTEAPIRIDGAVLRGRTLYVSLALMKQMDGSEADAVLAHEMAHFSGQDTLYSRKIAPLLARFGLYLESLADNPIALPVYHFMLGFRALSELSLKEHSRNREFRADRIAAETTSPRDVAGSLLRVTAYSDFRGKIQQELFARERALEDVGIATRLEREFHEHAVAFAAKPDLWALETTHPFDSHPPLARRLEAVGVAIAEQDVQDLVATPGDGFWYDTIDDAEAVEFAQWAQFEGRFRSYHESTLPYRFLPSNEEEEAIVAQAFPGLTIEGKKGTLALDHEGLLYTAWDAPIAFAEFTHCAINDGVLEIQYQRDGWQRATIPIKSFARRQVEAIRAIERYYGRYRSAAAYQEQKAEPSPEPKPIVLPKPESEGHADDANWPNGVPRDL